MDFDGPAVNLPRFKPDQHGVVDHNDRAELQDSGPERAEAHLAVFTGDGHEGDDQDGGLYDRAQAGGGQVNRRYLRIDAAAYQRPQGNRDEAEGQQTCRNVDVADRVDQLVAGKWFGSAKLG